MPTRMKTSWTGGFAASIVALALLAGGCGDGEIRGFSPDGTDYQMTARVPAGVSAVAVTDVRCTAAAGLPIMSFDVDVDFLAQGSAGGPVGPSGPLTQFRLLSYTVTYQNELPGGGPAPAPISVPLPFTEQAPATFSLENWPIMTAAQKNQFPLNDPDATFVNGELPLTATVTIFGAPVADINSVISTSLPISLTVVDTCDEVDPLTGQCPPALADPLTGAFCP